MPKRFFSKINKEIFALKLSVTTHCLLRCRYCFVRKTNQMMDFSTAHEAINLLLHSPGQKKMLIIYGGEPLLNPSLREIILEAKKSARLLKKELILSLATNGLLLNKENLNFFKQYNVKISISIDGRKKSHNQNRIFADSRGSFDAIVQNLPQTLKILKKQNISAIMTIAPNLAQNMFGNFSHLLRIGFENVHLDPIQGKAWTKYQKRNFCVHLMKIIDYLLGKIEEKKFIFLNPLNQFLAQKKSLNEIFDCPFYKCLEVYSQGEIAFSPFLLNLPEPQKKKYIVGHVKNGFIKKYQNCHFHQMFHQCQNCWSDYYQDINELKNEGAQLVNWRNQLCQRTANYIFQQSLSNKNFKKYIEEAKKRIFE